MEVKELNLHELNQTKLSIMKSTASLLNTYGVGTVSMNNNSIVVNGELMVYFDDDLVLTNLERLDLNVKQRIAIYSLTKALQFVISDMLTLREADNESYQENIDQWFKELEE